MEIPYGFCHCDCGQKTRIPTRSNRSVGQTRGAPLRYIKGHNPTNQIFGPRYVIEDCGYKTACHIWQGATDGHGYAQRRHAGRLMSAHKVAYEEKFGPIPDGLHLDHLCRVHLCINADHGEPVPQVENTRRGAQTKLTVESVRDIRRLREQGWKYRELAKEFAVSMSLVGGVIARRGWADVA